MSSGLPPSRLERKLTIKAKELKDALQSCHTLKDESVCMKKSLEDLQAALEEKEKALRSAEYERDLLEKEKVLYGTQVKVCWRLKTVSVSELLLRHARCFEIKIFVLVSTKRVRQKSRGEKKFVSSLTLGHFCRSFSWCRKRKPVIVSFH